MEVKYTSQAGQDKCVIEDIFRGMLNGIFVDIGAGDGVDISNTYVLEKYYGWTGLCVEPNSISFEKLKLNRKCIVDNSFILDNLNEIEYCEYYDEKSPYKWENVSSMIPNDKLKNVSHIKKTIRRIKPIALNQILDIYNIPRVINYLSLDVEGVEIDILKCFFKHNNFKYKIESMSIEHNFEPVRDDIRELLLINGFSLYKELEQDDIYTIKNEI